MGRAPCCDKASVKRGPWSPEEDELLRSYVHNHGTGGNWIALPQKAGLNRCGKSCRLRWLNYLRPDIKHGGYTEQEDQIICSLYSSIGSRWSIIASKLPGRTDNDVKNYWNTKLKKKALSISAVHHLQQDQYYSNHHHQAGRDRRAFVATPPPAPQQQQQQSQCASVMQPSPASASSAATTASGGGDPCGFGVPAAMYSSPSALHHQAAAAAALAPRYVDSGSAVPAPPPPQQHASFAEYSPDAGIVIADSWATTAGGGMATALDDMFLPELLAAGEFAPGDLHLLGGGFGSLLQDRGASAASLQELSACYFPNAQAEMWADAKPPPAGLCHSLT